MKYKLIAKGFLVWALSACFGLGLLTGCGRKGAEKPSDSGSSAGTVSASSEPQATAVAAQTGGAGVAPAEADAARFNRIAERVKSLLKARQYEAAAESIKWMESMNLTPDQRQLVNGFKAQLPK